MKEKQYIEKYGFDIFFPEDVKKMLGKELIEETDSYTIEGKIIDYKFSEDCILKEGEKYLAFQMLFKTDDNKEIWSLAYPTDIKAPPIYDDYTDGLTKRFKKHINNS